MDKMERNGSVAQLQRELTEGIWVRDTSETPLYLRKLKAVIRWAYLVITGFFEDQCIIRASALTFTTILSIVPFMAVAFSISKGFGLQNMDFIRVMLLRVTTGNAEVVEKILEYISNTNVQALGWVGIVALLGTVISLIGTIEKAFNTIWRVDQGRSYWRKLADFFPIIVITPALVLAASSATLSLKSENMVSQVLSVEAIGYIEHMVLTFAPMLLIWVAFSFMFAFIPYTKVRIQNAAVGGILAGTLWQVAQWAYINWQIGAANYNAIYGGFAQLPLLLMWIFISWVIVLLGAEISYASQNVNSYVKQRFFGKASPLQRQKIGVLMMVFLAKRFRSGEPLPSVEEISERILAPTALVDDIFEALVRAGLTVRTDNMSCVVYAPARALDEITIADVIYVLNADGGSGVGELFGERYAALDRIFDGLRSTVSKSSANLTLLDCAEELEEIYTPEGTSTCGPRRS